MQLRPVNGDDFVIFVAVKLSNSSCHIQEGKSDVIQNREAFCAQSKHISCVRYTQT